MTQEKIKRSESLVETKNFLEAKIILKDRKISANGKINIELIKKIDEKNKILNNDIGKGKVTENYLKNQNFKVNPIFEAKGKTEQKETEKLKKPTQTTENILPKKLPQSLSSSTDSLESCISQYSQVTTRLAKPFQSENSTKPTENKSQDKSLKTSKNELAFKIPKKVDSICTSKNGDYFLTSSPFKPTIVWQSKVFLFYIFFFFFIYFKYVHL